MYVACNSSSLLSIELGTSIFHIWDCAKGYSTLGRGIEAPLGRILQLLNYTLATPSY